MGPVGLFTIASKNYLSYVRVLLSSVAQFHPEYRLYLCLADRVDGRIEVNKEEFSIIEAEALGIPDVADMTLRYDIMEFNTAVKPFMFRWLFDNTDLDCVIYLDPDIRAYSRFNRVEDALRSGASAVLTPHVTEPLEDGRSPDDRHLLQAGVFNLGFAAFRRTPDALRYLDWWGRRLRTQCVSEPRSSLFVDQKWCDLAPCFLDGLHILKDPGYNVAYWNLAHRRISAGAGGGFEINGAPLAFFHFSGVSADEQRMVSKHQDRFEWRDIPGFQPLFETYFRELAGQGWESTRNWPYAFGRASADFQISPLVRKLYRQTYPEPRALPDGGLASFLTMLCNEPADGYPPDEAMRITALMKLVYQLRPDLQSAFALQVPDGRRKFAAWFEEAAGRDYNFPPVLARQALILGQPVNSAKRPRWPSAYRILMELDRLILNPIYRRLPAALKPAAERWFTKVSDWTLRRS